MLAAILLRTLILVVATLVGAVLLIFVTALEPAANHALEGAVILFLLHLLAILTVDGALAVFAVFAALF